MAKLRIFDRFLSRYLISLFLKFKYFCFNLKSNEYDKTSWMALWMEKIFVEICSKFTRHVKIKPVLKENEMCPNDGSTLFSYISKTSVIRAKNFQIQKQFFSWGMPIVRSVLLRELDSFDIFTIGRYSIWIRIG